MSPRTRPRRGACQTRSAKNCRAQEGSGSQACRSSGRGRGPRRSKRSVTGTMTENWPAGSWWAG
eukprot:15476723-Alexandrium_andersonii.AAC.1